MRALVLGCGEMGEVAIRDLHRYARLDEIVVGTRRPEPASVRLSHLQGGPRVRVVGIDVGDREAVTRLMDGVAVAINCAGPNYRYEIPVAEAAIAARVHLVDINDDYETTRAMLALDRRAREAGIVVVLGLGASPGVTNVLVRAAATQLDAVEEIHTAWLMSAADPGGPALARHLLYSLSHRALTVRDGRLAEVDSFVDGREVVDFPPPVGPREVFHVGHPEPITLQRAFPQARLVDDKATFHPPAVNDLIRALGDIVRQAPGPVPCAGTTVDAMDFAAGYLRAACASMPGIAPDGGLRVEVVGTRRGKRRRIVFATAGRLGQGTGVPASIGAQMILAAQVTERGVRPPEECIEPEEFLFQLFERRNLGELRGFSEELEEAALPA